MIRPQPMTAKTEVKRPATRRRAWQWWLIGLSVLNALAVLALFVLVCFVSEKWWVSAAISFVPRLPFAVPSVVLLVMTLLKMPRWSILNGLASVVGLVFIGGLCAPVDRDSRPDDSTRIIRLLSCNVQDGDSYPDLLLREFLKVDADVLVLQEALGCESIDQVYSDRHILQRGEYRIISRYPVRQVGELRTPTVFGNTGRLTATVFEVDHPTGTFQVVNVHCHTARWGLRELSWDSIVTGNGVEAFQTFQIIREMELNALAEYCAMAARRMPTLFVGDFNTPSSSSMFNDSWSRYRNAFESAGWGYGYTSPCNTANRWPNNTPWLRIDHILATSNWAIHSAAIGHTNGSDHRLVWAEVSLRE